MVDGAGAVVVGVAVGWAMGVPAETLVKSDIVERGLGGLIEVCEVVTRKASVSHVWMVATKRPSELLVQTGQARDGEAELEPMLQR